MFQLIPNLTTHGSPGRRRKWRVPQWTLPSQRSLRVPWQPRSLRVQNPSDKTSNTTTCHNGWKSSTWTKDGRKWSNYKEGIVYSQSLKLRSLEVWIDVGIRYSCHRCVANIKSHAKQNNVAFTSKGRGIAMCQWATVHPRAKNPAIRVLASDEVPSTTHGVQNQPANPHVKWQSETSWIYNTLKNTCNQPGKVKASSNRDALPKCTYEVPFLCHVNWWGTLGRRQLPLYTHKKQAWSHASLLCDSSIDHHELLANVLYDFKAHFKFSSTSYLLSDVHLLPFGPAVRCPLCTRNPLGKYAEEQNLDRQRGDIEPGHRHVGHQLSWQAIGCWSYDSRSTEEMVKTHTTHNKNQSKQPNFVFSFISIKKQRNFEHFELTSFQSLPPSGGLFGQDAFDLSQHPIQPCQAQQSQGDLQQTQVGHFGSDDDPTKNHIDPQWNNRKPICLIQTLEG